MIYVILGMHKSGTTLVAKMLHKSGINMGEFKESFGYDSGNKYEFKETQEINKAMLHCGDELSLNVFYVIDEDRLTKENEIKIINLINRMNRDFTHWGFKDPRTCLTYDIWHNFLPKHRIVLVFRSPWEVWSHYQKNIRSVLRLHKKISMGWKALTAWYIYNNAAVRHIDQQHNAEAILIEYAELMNGNKEFRRLENFLGLKLHDSRKLNLYRSRARRSLLYNLMVWLQALYSRDIEKLYKQMRARCF